MFENKDAAMLNRMAEIGTKVDGVGTKIDSVEAKCVETNTKVTQFTSGAVNSSPVQYKISTLKNNLSYVDCTDTYFNNFNNQSGAVTFFVFNDGICKATYSNYSVYLQGSLNPNNPDEYIQAEKSPKCGDQYHAAITIAHKNRIHAIGSYHYIYDYNSGWTQSTKPSDINTSSTGTSYYISTEYFLHCFNVTSGSVYTVKHSIFNGESWSATETIIDEASSFQLLTNPVNSLIYFVYGKKSGGVDIKHYCKMSNSNFTEISIDDVPKCLYNETYGVASSFVPIDDNNYAVYFANKGVYLLNATGALNFAFQISDIIDIYKANDQYYAIAKSYNNNYYLYRIINFCTSYCSDTLRCLKGNKILCSSKAKPLTSNVKRINDNMLEVTETGDVQLWLQKTGEDDHDFDFAIS